MAQPSSEIPESLERKSVGAGLCYLLAVLSGALAGWLNIKVGDLLLTAMTVLAANMLLGFFSPRRPWRWVLVVGAFVPILEWLAYNPIPVSSAGAKKFHRLVQSDYPNIRTRSSGTVVSQLTIPS